MAGWSKVEDNLCINQYNETIKSKELEMQSYFIELVSGFLRDYYGNYCFRPLPPRLGNGQSVDLLKLYLVVKQKGGFEFISENNWWGEVGLQCGSVSSFGSAFKLIYAQYLSSFESWLVELDKKTLGRLEKDYGAYVSEVRDMKRGSDGDRVVNLEKSGVSFIDLTDVDVENESEKLDREKFEKVLVGYEGLNEGNKKCLKSTDRKVDSVVGSNSCIVEESRGLGNTKQAKSEISSEYSVASKMCSIQIEEELMNVDVGVSKEISSHKRKRDCFSEMLEWMVNVAKDPTASMIGKTLKCSQSALYGNQALLARESLFLKKLQRQCVRQSGCYSFGLSGCQKKQKRHPSLFNHCEKMLMSTCRPTAVNSLPPRQRLEARLDKRPTLSITTTRPHPLSRQRNSLGIADVPKWTGLTIESDPKWLGTQTWPLENVKNKQPIERDPVGKGRVDDCGCQFPASVECVKFHVSQRRKKIMFELRSAYYAWSFDKIGEDCSISWTIEEEKKFRRVIRENPRFSQKCFWEPMCKAIPQKRWDDQVKYYYNVFMLRRRAYQNRHYPNDIDSDDDETEYRSTNNSIRLGKLSEAVYPN